MFTDHDSLHLTVHVSVHRSINCKWRQTRCNYIGLFIYSWSAVHVSGDVFAHHQEHPTVFTASGNVHRCCCRLVSYKWDVPSHPWHQPAATSVDITRSCKYSHVLLMMGENIARNMYSWPGVNKYTYIVAFCWSSFTVTITISNRNPLILI